MRPRFNAYPDVAGGPSMVDHQMKSEVGQTCARDENASFSGGCDP